MLTRDITERRRMERAQRLFAEAGRVSPRASDPDERCEELARLCVPELADACILFLLNGEAGRSWWPRTVAVERSSAGGAAARASHEAGTGGWGPQAVLHTGCPELLTELTPELMRAPAGEGPVARCERLGVRSSSSVPLRWASARWARSPALAASRRRSYTEGPAFLEELARPRGAGAGQRAALREAQEALELIGVAAHDLGNPLHTLQLLLRQLRARRTPAEDREKLREGLARRRAPDAARWGSCCTTCWTSRACPRAGSRWSRSRWTWRSWRARWPSASPTRRRRRAAR